MKQIRERMKQLYWYTAEKQVEAIGVIEVILILVIIIGLVLIFRNQIVSIIQSAFDSINGSASGINEEIKIE